MYTCLTATQACNTKQHCSCLSQCSHTQHEQKCNTVTHEGWKANKTIEVLQCALLLQAHPELRNLYTMHTEGLIHALMRKSVSLLRQQQAPAAVGAAQQAFAMVQQLRCLPLLQAQAAALLGHCCTVHSHLINAPLAAGSLSAFVTIEHVLYICWIA